jgi:hypothetical protein
MASNGDAPRPDELVPTGGAWRGLLFDNPRIGLDARLTWTFDLSFREVEREYGSTPVSLTADWVPLPGASWKAMAGHDASSEVFGEPIECSAYFFEHYPYDRARVNVLEQDDKRIRVRVQAAGDVDGLGIPSWSIEQWVIFEGIAVQLTGVEGLDEAAAQLRRRTDISGLSGKPTPQGFRFRPVHPSADQSKQGNRRRNGR